MPSPNEIKACESLRARADRVQNDGAEGPYIAMLYRDIAKIVEKRGVERLSLGWLPYLTAEERRLLGWE